MKITRYVYVVLMLMILSCSSKKSEVSFDVDAYQAEVEQWHAGRIESLKSANGWLNLAGLFWLKEGVSTFGSDESNDIVFPKDKIPAKAGLFLLQKGMVTMTTLPTVEMISNDAPIKSGTIFHPDSTRQPKLSYGSLQWFVIKRDDQFGIRLRDLESATVKEFHGIERYEVDPDFRTEARLEVPAVAKKIDITNVLGQTTAQDSPGTLVFTIRKKEYRLDALLEGEELFVIFGDPTNENETYPSGRYMYAKKPGADGKTILDFNKAFNPPCAFTPFATCPLPPKQNVLALAIMAGEMNYKGYDH
jgi:uncharacterized protein (DUF1684 family)